jgi:hypothetical protein
MPSYPNLVQMVGFTRNDPEDITASVSDLTNAGVAPRRAYPMPFNVQGFADTRPRVGQLWPRGDGQSYGQ